MTRRRATRRPRSYELENVTMPALIVVAERGRVRPACQLGGVAGSSRLRRRRSPPCPGRPRRSPHGVGGPTGDDAQGHGLAQAPFAVRTQGDVWQGGSAMRERSRRHAVRLAATQLPAWPCRRVERWQASATPNNGWSSTTASCISDIESVSTHLSALGLEKGDVLCLLLPNWTEAVIYTYAASRLGAVVCPITTIYRQRELSFILERTECKVIVIPSVYRGFDYAAMVHELADGLPDLKHVICVGDTDVDGLPARATTSCERRPSDSRPSRVGNGRRRRGAGLHLRDHRRAERRHALGAPRCTR